MAIRLKGNKVSGLNKKDVVFPRGDHFLHFTVQAVPSQQPFLDICEQPEPPERTHADGRVERAVDHPKYQEALTAYITNQLHWYVITSLQATEGLEWERVDPNKPDTWGEWEKELKESDLVPAEIAALQQAVMEVNSLDGEMLKAARDTFLAMTPAERQEATRLVEQPSMDSGEPVSD